MRDPVPYGFYTGQKDECFRLNRYANVQKRAETVRIRNRIFSTVVDIKLPAEKQDAFITLLKRGFDSGDFCERLAEYAEDRDGNALFISLLKGCALE